MDIKRAICKRRPLCVIEESLRWLYHKAFGFVFDADTPVWYCFGRPCSPKRPERQPLDANWYKIKRRLYRREHIYYSIANALAVNPKLQGIALIFFMGIGDYLYTTPMLQALRQKYPQLKFYGYVSSVSDRNNSPLVKSLLDVNPNIDKTFYFEGYRNPLVWKNYNYDDAFKNIPPHFLVMPVYYDYNVDVPHRTISLFETFGLQAPKTYLPPVFYFNGSPAASVSNAFITISARAAGKKGIVFLQMDSRGSSYTYPHIDELILMLIDEGYFVMSVTPSDVLDDSFYQVNIKDFAFNDTCRLLHMLKAAAPTYIIAINSVFWAASAGLDIPNLGLQHWYDKKLHNLWYPNITVVTDQLYPLLPAGKQILAAPADYTPHNKKIIDFKPGFVLASFKNMVKQIKNPR